MSRLNYAECTNQGSKVPQTFTSVKRLHLASTHKLYKRQSMAKNLYAHALKKLKFKLDRNSLETIYITLDRDDIWDNCTQADKNELDKIQN